MLLSDKLPSSLDLPHLGIASFIFGIGISFATQNDLTSFNNCSQPSLIS
jgi:hypothetical protein